MDSSTGSGSYNENQPQQSSSYSCYRNIDKHSRNLLKRIYHWEFVRNLDQQLMDFSHLPQTESQTFTFSNSFHRLILHALCQYYRLISTSFDCSNKRVVLVKKRKQTDDEFAFPPHECLCHLLSDG